MTSPALLEVERYQRCLFDKVDSGEVSVHAACCCLFGVMATLVAFWMEDAKDRELHMDTIELKFRETVYDMMRQRGKRPN